MELKRRTTLCTTDLMEKRMSFQTPASHRSNSEIRNSKAEKKSSVEKIMRKTTVAGNLFGRGERKTTWSSDGDFAKILEAFAEAWESYLTNRPIMSMKEYALLKEQMMEVGVPVESIARTRQEAIWSWAQKHLEPSLKVWVENQFDEPKQEN